MRESSSATWRAVLAASALTACTAGPRAEAPASAGASASTRAESGGSARAAVVGGVDGVYVLDSIMSRPIPAEADEAAPGEPRLEVLAETLWLRADGSFVGRSHWRQTERGQRTVGVYVDSGRYTLEALPVMSAEGLLVSGDIVLRSPPNRRARMWVRDDGRTLVGPGLPRPPGGTAMLVPWWYRRVRK